MNKPDVTVEYNFYRSRRRAEKFFNKTNPQELNARRCRRSSTSRRDTSCRPVRRSRSRRSRTATTGSRSRSPTSSRTSRSPGTSISPSRRGDRAAVAAWGNMRHTSRIDRISRLGVAMVCALAPCSRAGRRRPARAVSTGSGAIESSVQDEAGVPVAGAVVSATGAGTVFGVTDSLGRVTLRSLAPGPYLLRAHSAGFTAPRGQTVQVLASTRASSRRLPSGTCRPPPR